MNDNWRKFPYPVVATLLFFIIGYLTNAWDKAWVVYLTVPIYYSFASSKKNKSKSDPPASDDPKDSKKDSHDDWKIF